MNILILGANGFIGSGLTHRLLGTTDWTVWGIDLAHDRLTDVLDHTRFHFDRADITQDNALIEERIQASDVILPLVAIAHPAVYVNDPLRVYELDFEANIPIIRACVRHQKRLVFPSTSEVYGICGEQEVHEDSSNCVLGPIHKQRWIYSASKQLLDRIIYAYSIRDQLDYTLFRPFNWIGSALDTLEGQNSRSVTKFIGQILRGEAITLVGDGTQRRSFTDIEDGLDALVAIIKNENKQASRQIFNIGNPHNDTSIKNLVERLSQLIQSHPRCPKAGHTLNIKSVDPHVYYGPHYQDTQMRIPSINKASKHLDWTPRVTLDASLKKIVDFHLTHFEA